MSSSAGNGSNQRLQPRIRGEVREEIRRSSVGECFRRFQLVQMLIHLSPRSIRMVRIFSEDTSSMVVVTEGAREGEWEQDDGEVEMEDVEGEEGNDEDE